MELWLIRLDLSEQARLSLHRTLSGSERERARAFHWEQDRKRFVVARGALRDILSRYLGHRPEQLRFCYGPHGKPALHPAFSAPRVRFNLAHCEDLALVAVSEAADLGVDIERVRVMPDASQLVMHFFSPRESATFATLPEAQKPKAFFRLWTRKEAWLKATGEGIGQQLSQVEVSFLPDEPARLLAIPSAFTHTAWSLADVEPAPGFAGALAVARPEVICRYWIWNQTADAGSS